MYGMPPSTVSVVVVRVVSVIGAVFATLVKQVTAGNRATTYEYDASSRLTRTIGDPNDLGRRTEFAYDAAGNIIRAERSGKPSNTGSGQADRPEVTEFGYDQAGRRTSQTIHNGQERYVTTWMYDERGLPISATDPRGNTGGTPLPAFTTTMAYDELARPIQATGPRVATETGGGVPVQTQATMLTGYDAFGSVTHAKDPLGRVTTAEYDRLGRMTKTSLPAYTPPGSATPITPSQRLEYDALGRVIKQIDARNNATELRYDQLGRLLERRDPQVAGTTSGVWKYSYPLKGLPLTATSPTGARVEATYDALDRKITSTALERYPAPAAFTTSYRYDDAGNVVSVQTPSGDKSTFAYDKLNQMITAVDPAGVTTL
jgi:YD repeat-containing protein